MTTPDGRGGPDRPTPARPASAPAHPCTPARRGDGLPAQGGSQHYERGAVTAETALVIPVVVLFLATLLAAATAGLAQLQCIDAARAGARAAARHDDPHPPAAAEAPAGAEIRVRTTGDLVKVQVSTQLALPLPGHPHIAVRAESTAQTEPDTPEVATG